ncbi:MAG: cytochrome P450, partial [Ktedonobacteraceae bacterium]|nr:cytochrome P450 [Ktedonobacteraceae bacterium]
MAQKASASLTAHLLKEPLHPFPWYRRMREQHPVYYSPEFNSWFIARYNDVQFVIANPELFSSQQTIRRRSSSKEGKAVRTLLWADPPHHRQLRSLVSQAFTPRTIAGLAPRITEIAHAHLDVVARQGVMDIINDLANPLPIIVIAELLGISTRDRQQFKRWSDSIVSPRRLEKKQAVIEMNAYFLNIIAQRREQKQDDLISALLSAEIESVSLSDADLLNFCRLLLVAGHETSTNLIGNALLTFDEYPEVMDELRNDPRLIANAVEEVIRYR